MTQQHIFEHSTILLAFLTLNGLLVMLLIGIYFVFIFYEFKNKRNLFLSFIIKSYMPILFIPSLYYSIKVRGVCGYINIPLTFLLGNHQNPQKNWPISDCFEKIRKCNMSTFSRRNNKSFALSIIGGEVISIQKDIEKSTWKCELIQSFFLIR